MNDTMNWDAILADALATMSRYVQFDTTNPPGNEMPAAEWLADQLRERGITRDITIYEPAPGRGLLVGRIAGSEPLKPLLLNHHMDVVAADPAQWTHPPFSGAVADGFVWGRGTLDTKDLGVMFLLALDSLLKEGVRFRRPIIFLAVPDEETGGSVGMRWLTERHLVGLDPEWVWDEGSGGLRGMFGERVMFGVAVAEKRPHNVRLVATGDPGHGSMPHANNAVATLVAALNRILRHPRPAHLNAVTAAMFRALAGEQKFPASFLLRHLDQPLILRLALGRLSADKLIGALLRDTISPTILRAGYKINVIPERAEAELDCRLLPETDATEFVRWLEATIADRRVRVEVGEAAAPSGIAPMEGPFYEAIRRAVATHVPAAGLFPLLVPGATDGRYFRQRGYAAYGFGPVILDRTDLGRVHGIDERISAENLLLGIKITREIIRDLCA
jgi:acetylornithine deacetylase/succinyl-diaminopimelate desuccinylase-like protein